MKKLKRMVVVWLSLLVTLLTGLCFVGCNSAGSKQGKYDVSFWVKHTAIASAVAGGRWLFSPDVDEITINQPYDGFEHNYTVEKYQLVNHPQFGDKWLTPLDSSDVDFSKDVLYTDENGKQDVTVTTVKEKGTYLISFRVDNTRTCNYRWARLYVHVS